MKIDIKKVLLAGTAIVAVTGFGSVAKAQDYTLTTDAIWAASAGATGADILNAQEGDSVELDGFELGITDDASPAGGPAVTPADGGTAGVLSLGAITDGDGGGDLTIFQSAGALTVDILSAQVGDDVQIGGSDAADANVDVDFTGDLTVGGDLDIVNNDSDNGDEVSVTIGDDLVVDGQTTVTGGDAGANAFLTLLGDATFGGGIVLTSAGGGAFLEVISNATQTIAGDIDNGGGGQGDLFIMNSSTAGAVFTGNVGDLASITLSSAGSNTNATFRGDVDAAVITLGDGAATDTNTLTFSSAGDRMVSSDIDGTAGDIDRVVVSGGGTTNSTGVWGAGGELNLLTVSGTGTELDADGAITVDDVVIGTGATLDMGALLTADVSMSGTLNLTAGGGVTGDIVGASGTLQVDADATVTGSITNLDLINVADGFTLTVSGANDDESVSADAIVINDAAGANEGIDFDAVGNTITVGSDITTAANHQGRIQLLNNAGAGEVAFEGDIGEAGTSLGVLNYVNAANTEVLTTEGSIFVDTVNFTNADDVMAFLGDGNIQYVSANMIGNGGGDGDLYIGDGDTDTDVRFLALLGNGGNTLSTVTVNEGARAEFDASATFTGNLLNDGEVQINAGSTVTAGGFAAGTATGGNFVFGIDRAGLDDADPTVAFGQLDLTAGVDLSDETMEINVESGVLVDETIAGILQNVAVAPTIQDTVLYDFTLTANLGDFDLDIVTNDISDIASTPNNARVANVLLFDDELIDTTDENLLALQASVQNATTDEEFNNALEQAQPTIDGSNVVVAMDVVNNNFEMVGDRLAMLRTGDDVTGMTTGNVSEGVRLWTQGFGVTGEQEHRDGIDGYDFDTWGVGFGIDSENVAENAVVGIAFSYADTDADSDNGSRTNTEVDSYQFTVYGDYDVDERTYVDGMFAYTLNDTSTRRLVTGSTASGDFDADQFTLRGEVGRDYEYEQTTFTPHVLGHWSHYDPDSYRETGAGGAGLIVDGDAIDVVELGVGLDVSWMFQNSDGSYFSPVLSAGYRYDFADDDIQMTSQFVGGGQAFETSGFDPQQSTVDLGAGFTYYATDNWELTAEYDYAWKEDFDSHAGLFRAAYRF